MVSVDDSGSHSYSNITSPNTQTRSYYFYTPPPSSARISRSMGRSMRKFRSNIFGAAQHQSGAIPGNSHNASENLSDSVIDFRLGELASKSSCNSKSPSSSDFDGILDISTSFRDVSACSSDISGELQRLASLPDPIQINGASSEPESEPCSGFLQRETFSAEIIESISPEDLQPAVKLCVDDLQSPSVTVKRSAAAKLRLLAKNRADNRALIGESGAVPALVALLRCSDAMTQEHPVTALHNLSLYEGNKILITIAGGIKSLIYVLKTGTEIS